MASKRKAKPGRAAARATAAELTPKQRRFVVEYLVDLNATQAAIRSGYSKRTAGSIGQENLKKPEIAAAIQEAMGSRSMRTLVTADRVLEEIARLAFSDLRGFYTDDGRLKRPHELTADQVAALAAVESFEEYEGRGEERELIGFTRKVKLWDKRAALELLSKHLGLLKERVEHSGEVTVRRTIVHTHRRDNGDGIEADEA